MTANREPSTMSQDLKQQYGRCELTRRRQSRRETVDGKKIPNGSKARKQKTDKLINWGEAEVMKLT